MVKCFHGRNYSWSEAWDFATLAWADLFLGLFFFFFSQGWQGAGALSGCAKGAGEEAATHTSCCVLPGPAAAGLTLSV